MRGEPEKRRETARFRLRAFRARQQDDTKASRAQRGVLEPHKSNHSSLDDFLANCGEFSD